MDLDQLIKGLMQYVALVILLTFHEWGHAWMAWKCGDDTAKDQGRCSLNPLVHIDPIGTVIMPLLMIFLSLNGSGLSQFMIGWAKPVPVNPANLRNQKLDDILISMAGPWMNLLLAVVLVGLARVSLLAGAPSLVEFLLQSAGLSLLLCFFNLIPVPPLDGSHIMRIIVGMSRETYLYLARFGFIVVILLLQVKPIRTGLGNITIYTLEIIAGWFGMGRWIG